MPDDRSACVFCRIARGEDPDVQVVYEDDRWLAFFPDTPATPGHTLLVSREHFEDFWALDGELAAALAVAAVLVGQAIEAALNPEGMNLITSKGRVAEQTVKHVHVHLVPRWPGDPVGPIWPPKKEPDLAALARMADAVRVMLRTV